MRTTEPLDLPKHITGVFSLLDELGLPAWLVGGCLRDILMGRTPKDWDFATPCPPGLVREKLSGAGIPLWDTGLKHGTLTFRPQRVAYEITAFRIDGPYEDFRRPKWVTFTDSLREDLARRDFTVNAIAYHWRDGLTDPFGGIADIAKRVIRAVGQPRDRLQEDALRILRGIRFAGSLDFSLDNDLSAAMMEKADLLRWISPERLASELKAMLSQPSPRRALELLGKLQVWHYLAPEMVKTIDFDQNSNHHYLNLYDHLIQTAEKVPPELVLRLAALFHDIAKPVVYSMDEQGKSHFHHHERAGAEITAGILDRLRFSHEVRDSVVLLIRHHMLHLKTLTGADIRRIVSDLPKPRGDNLERILLLQEADLTASRYTDESFGDLRRFARRSREVLESGCPLDISDLVVKCGELAGLGVAPVDRGKALKAMLAEVLREPGNNQRHALLRIAAAYQSADSQP
jgi:tRNA nucleotidyltransferase (CCA-adding enzyme)